MHRCSLCRLCTALHPVHNLLARESHTPSSATASPGKLEERHAAAFVRAVAGGCDSVGGDGLQRVSRVAVLRFFQFFFVWTGLSLAPQRLRNVFGVKLNGTPARSTLHVSSSSGRGGSRIQSNREEVTGNPVVVPGS